MLTVEDGYGVIDKEAISAFTHGQCHALAYELNRLTGWRIVGRGQERYSPGHCTVYCPQLKGHVDIRGLRNPSVLGKITNPYIRPNLIVSNGLLGYLYPDFKAAKPFARTLLRDINEVLVRNNLQPVKEKTWLLVVK